jgi:hypothetical protein
MCRLVDKDSIAALTLEDIRSLGGFKSAIEEGVLDVETLQARARGQEIAVEDLTGETSDLRSENDHVHPSKRKAGEKAGGEKPKA